MTRDLQKAQVMSETGIRNNEIAMESHYFTLMDTAPVGCGGLSLDCFEPELHGTQSRSWDIFPGPYKLSRG